MSEKKAGRTSREVTGSDQPDLKKAVIAAIIEALILIPVLLYLMLR
jgi:hypothetical protein